MHLGPREYKPELSTRKVASQHLQRVDLDLGAVSRGARMEVGRPVVIEVHRDREPEKAAYCRHPHNVG